MSSIVFTQYDDIDIDREYYITPDIKDSGLNILHKLCLFPEKLREYLHQSKLGSQSEAKESKTINLNCTTKNEKFTPLMIAVCNNVVESVEILLQNNVDVNQQDNDDYTALMLACGFNYKDNKIINLLLQRNDIDINLQNFECFTALMIACLYKNIDCIKLLLQRKDININILDEDNSTILMIACYNDNVECVKLLLQIPEVISNINVQDNDGYTALMYACCECCKETEESIQILKLLLEIKSESDLRLVNVNLKNNIGDTALIIACANENIETIKLLLDHRSPQAKLGSSALVNIQNNEGNTALMETFNTEILKLLLDRDELNVNLKNNKGENALMIAYINEEIEIIKLLLQEQDIDIEPLLNRHTLKKEYYDLFLPHLIKIKDDKILKKLPVDLLVKMNLHHVNVNDQKIRLTSFDYNTILIHETKKCIQ